ncbi:nitrate reductase molybdenum cofactor assembly chaperone [Paenibacillus sp. MBLB2552]|uniref:Nitrate reductase molybdenum cofactor assembly chaperone n=1 Tax=Paenibacillus mellifer TaxID=2937794 RepID=A0A9X1XUY7_9BACL|nr:nitrate reductase molybdenum cofactor assembly chaperone [Paenibacillus mellifer]MCK8486060.1 nitrate reductase molybdenum cofactor assembly chaperone [Paenibacillus mellifer]
MVEAMEAKRMGLAVTARLLGYPDEAYAEVLSETLEAVSELEDPARKSRLETVIHPLQSLPLRELREQYVWTFDWKDKTGLYLTSHELGDSRERGAALILLQHIISDAGYAAATGELADYMPLLYELLAMRPDHVHVRALELRLAVATKRVADHLSEDSPYRELFVYLMEEVFGEPSEEDIRRLEAKREQADLDELPYPILYGMDGTARTGSDPTQFKMCN